MLQGERTMAKRNVLVVIGGEYHPYEECGAILKALLEASGRYTAHVTDDRDALKAGSINRFDAVVAYTQGGEPQKAQLDGLLNFVRKGGALVGLHSAVATWKKEPAYAELLGARFKGHGPGLSFPITPTSVDSMITRRIGPFRLHDELFLLDGVDAAGSEVLATAHWQGKEEPMAYTRSYGAGKVFVLLPGHSVETFSDATYQKLVLRGLDWTLGRQEKTPVKAGVVGYGPSFNMGRAHMTMMREQAGFDTVAACDIDPARCAAAEEENPGITTYRSLKAMLDKSDAELVVVITPHNLHAKQVLQILESGRHAITEKPFCVTVDEATAMIDTAHAKKRMLSVFHNRRWDGDYMTLRKVIADGLIGDVFHIECCFGGYGHPSFWWRSHKPIAGGAFYDWGAHFLDWILNLVPSKITEVSGYFQFKRQWHDVTNEDHCEAVVRFANGCRAGLEISSLAAIGKKRWRILGTQGAIEDLGNEKFRLVSMTGGVQQDVLIDYLPSDWEAYYRNIADHLLLDEPLAVTPESARRVIGVIETAEKSSRAGKALPVPKVCE